MRNGCPDARPELARPYARAAWSALPAVIVAGGPSLSDEQLRHVEFRQEFKHCHVIAVNNTFERAPFANACYFGDFTAIKHYFPKLRHMHTEWVTADGAAAERFKMTRLKPTDVTGLCRQRVHMNGNSGAQAISVAACWGASRILLLGFDMKLGPNGEKHHFGDHPSNLVQAMLFDEWIGKLAIVASDAKALGIEIINCTPESALPHFPMADIREVL